MPLKQGDTVTCITCGRSYILQPMDDYFNATNSQDGQCEACLVKSLGCSEVIVLNPGRGEELQQAFERSASAPADKPKR